MFTLLTTTPHVSMSQGIRSWTHVYSQSIKILSSLAWVFTAFLTQLEGPHILHALWAAPFLKRETSYTHYGESFGIPVSTGHSSTGS